MSDFHNMLVKAFLYLRFLTTQHQYEYLINLFSESERNFHETPCSALQSVPEEQHESARIEDVPLSHNPIYSLQSTLNKTYRLLMLSSNKSNEISDEKSLCLRYCEFIQKVYASRF